jgi:hypothetical protein
MRMVEYKTDCIIQPKCFLTLPIQNISYTYYLHREVDFPHGNECEVYQMSATVTLREMWDMLEAVVEDLKLRNIEGGASQMIIQL